MRLDMARVYAVSVIETKEHVMPVVTDFANEAAALTRARADAKRSAASNASSPAPSTPRSKRVSNDIGAALAHATTPALTSANLDSE